MKNGNKVVLIGDGFVGSSYAFSLINSGLATELAIIDIRKDKELADVNDLLDATVLTSSATIVKRGDYEDCKDCDLVVLAYGNSQKNLKDRLDDIKIASEMVLATIPKVVDAGYKGVILLATNPVDVIARVVREVSDFPFEKIVGTGTSLDTARFAQYLAIETGFNVSDINAYVIGEHGNSSVAVWSNANINGIGIDKFIKNIDNSYKDKVGEMIRDKAFRIIEGKGATHFGIANCLLTFTRAILLDEKKVLMASAYLRGEYKNEGLYTGVPTVIGKNGAEKILEMPIDDREQKMFDASCKALKENFLLADLGYNK